MSRILYFAKINLTSHIFKVYENPNLLSKILNELNSSITNNTVYYKEVIGIDDDGNKYINNVKYFFNLIENLGDKYDDAIVGNIVKTSNIFAKDVNEITGEIKKIPVENDEVVQFYFDVGKERVAFYTSLRFGYQEFALVFRELINECLKNAGKNYVFDVELLKQGLDLLKIKEELRSIGRIETLTVEIKAPNPDPELLNEIHNNGHGYLEKSKAGKVTHRSVILRSNEPEGLNLDAEIINDELDKIEEIHPSLRCEEALEMGYARVDALAKNGREYSTKDNHLVKSQIDDKNVSIIDFANICRVKILALLR